MCRMGSAKDIILKVIPSKLANEFVRKHHYSGKVVNNSQLHFGVFYKGGLHGVMQYGPSLDKSKIKGLVKGTKWNEFIELNRMAFDDILPKNSESRAISVSIKLLKRHAPHIKWMISYADGAQCGSGTIYRASGFYISNINKNKTILKLKNGVIVADKTLNDSKYIIQGKGAGWFKRNGAKPLDGYQIRYIYFIDKTYKDKLTVPIIPYSKLDELTFPEGVRHKEHLKCASSSAVERPVIQQESGGSIPTLAHQ